MTIVIKYRARLSYMWQGVYHRDELCDVTHEIDNDTLRTTGFDFKPVTDDKGVTK